MLIDSTTVTVGGTRLPWAPYHGERAGIKLHVTFHAASSQPQNVIEKVGSRHDGPVGEELAHSSYIHVQDRAYGKIERFDRYKTEGQSFVIRLKENVQTVSPHSLRRVDRKQTSLQLPRISLVNWEHPHADPKSVIESSCFKMVMDMKSG
ncbi:transposase [Paenibacillus suaedae]|uniref:transposase n=1 Tax=Paenibacillus suaedae TaxID=3077233 RepID=UPI00374294DB